MNPNMTDIILTGTRPNNKKTKISKYRSRTKRYLHPFRPDFLA